MISGVTPTVIKTPINTSMGTGMTAAAAMNRAVTPLTQNKTKVISFITPPKKRGALTLRGRPLRVEKRCRVTGKN
jgi:hypothetical protein